jgi:hypothetical protein
MLSAPYPAVEISKETTWFTGPVDEDGYVNYPAALRELTVPDQKDAFQRRRPRDFCTYRLNIWQLQWGRCLSTPET